MQLQGSRVISPLGRPFSHPSPHYDRGRHWALNLTTILAPPTLQPTLRFGRQAKPPTFFARLYQTLKSYISMVVAFFHSLLRPASAHSRSVKIILPRGTTLKVDKDTLVRKAFEAHEHAVKASKIGNETGHYFGTNLLLNNGVWDVATNFVIRYGRVQCSERSALAGAYDKTLGKHIRTEQTNNPKTLDKVRAGLKADLLVIASHDLEEYTTPCGDCLDWMTSEQFFSPETQIASIQRNSKGQLQIRVLALKQLLPYWGSFGRSLASTEITPEAWSYPVDVSKRAKAALANPSNQNLTQPRLLELMKAAQAACTQNTHASISKNNYATSVLFTNSPNIHVDAKKDFSRRYFTHPSLHAVSDALNEQTENGRKTTQSRLQAIAFYGDDPNTPSIKEMAILAKPPHGGLDTIVLTLGRNNRLHVRTIQDYMPYLYMTPAMKEGQEHQ